MMMMAGVIDHDEDDDDGGGDVLRERGLGKTCHLKLPTTDEFAYVYTADSTA